MKGDRYENAVDQLAKLLNLTEEAISVAEGWSVLPESIQHHIKLLIDDHIARLHPTLAEIYSHAREADQLRFNRIVERVQARRRTPPNS